MIAKSAMDESWAEVVGKQKGKVLVVIEGLTMYLTEGMKVMYPAYGLIGWIPAVQNIANRLVVLRKGMDINLLFKIAAIGILVAVLHQVLSKAGRDDQAMMTSLAGIVIVLSPVQPKNA